MGLSLRSYVHLQSKIPKCKFSLYSLRSRYAHLTYMEPLASLKLNCSPFDSNLDFVDVVSFELLELAIFGCVEVVAI